MANTNTEDSKSISVTNTDGDVIGVGVSGMGHIIGKEVRYTVQGNVLNFNLSGDLPKGVIDSLQKVTTESTLEERDTLIKGSVPDKEDSKIKSKLEESSNAQKLIRSVLEVINEAEKKEGTQIQKIQAGNIQISKNQLLLKEYLSKGFSHLMRQEYSEAIECYDKALEINPKNVHAWDYKGNALSDLGKYKEAIGAYDRAIEINPNVYYVWYNKGLVLQNLGKYQDAVKCFDKAIELKPDNSFN